MERIFISACFLGENVKYDGGHQQLLKESLFYKTIEEWKKEDRLISGCPECLGGLSVPREPAEIQQVDRRVITIKNADVTDNFHRGALKTLAICLENNIKLALLKESSPSCGSHYIYDGTFAKTKIVGKGVTTQLLEKHHINVFSENTIEALINHINR